MKLAYKVTTSENQSVCSYLPTDFIVTYKINEFVSEIQMSKYQLFVFKRLKDAYRFYRECGSKYYKLWLVETSLVIKRKSMLQPYSTFHLKQPNLIIDSPQGTYSTDKVKLLEEIKIPDIEYIPENVFK